MKNNPTSALVISDMRMPRMSGLEFVKQAKSEFPEKKFHRGVDGFREAPRLPPVDAHEDEVAAVDGLDGHALAERAGGGLRLGLPRKKRRPFLARKRLERRHEDVVGKETLGLGLDEGAEIAGDRARFPAEELLDLG